MTKKKRRTKPELREPVRRDTSDRARRRRRPAGPRQEKRRKKRGMSAGQVDLLYKLLLAASLIAAVVFVCTTFFRVKTIAVVGNVVCRAEQVAAASGVSLEDKLLFVNRFDASDGIFEALPYVDEVRISKRYPSTLQIEITEATPAAAVISGGTAYLIDRNAKLLEYGPNKADYVQGLIIEGLEVTEPAAGDTIALADELRLTTLQTILDALLEHPITEHIGVVRMDKLYGLSFTYDERIVVELGDSTQLSEKLEMLGAVLEGFDGTEKGRLDVSLVSRAHFLPDNNAVSGAFEQ